MKNELKTLYINPIWLVLFYAMVKFDRSIKLISFCWIFYLDICVITINRITHSHLVCSGWMLHDNIYKIWLKCFYLNKNLPIECLSMNGHWKEAGPFGISHPKLDFSWLTIDCNWKYTTTKNNRVTTAHTHIHT